MFSKPAFIWAAWKGCVFSCGLLWLVQPTLWCRWFECMLSTGAHAFKDTILFIQNAPCAVLLFHMWHILLGSRVIGWSSTITTACAIARLLLFLGGPY